jgi:hypothetical protein
MKKSFAIKGSDPLTSNQKQARLISRLLARIKHGLSPITEIVHCMLRVYSPQGNVYLAAAIPVLRQNSWSVRLLAFIQF